MALGEPRVEGAVRLARREMGGSERLPPAVGRSEGSRPQRIRLVSFTVERAVVGRG
ncbi:MAG: hypothetical protein ACKO5K_03010 [Armatimonadota bacterium]